MNDTQLERILKEQREEYQRFVGVIFEDFKSCLQLIAESVEGLQKQLSDLRDMVARNAEDIEIIKMNLEFIKTGLKKKVDLDEFAALERRVALLEKRRTVPSQ